MPDRFIVISGCSAGGKSTLIAELAARGHATVPEPGRRIVQAELAAAQPGGPAPALPWTDPAAFAAKSAALALADLARAKGDAARRTPHARIFFDRSFIEPLVWFERQGLPLPPALAEAASARRYARDVFLAPPWPELHRPDPERRLPFEDALAEYEALTEAFPRLGHQLHILPKLPVPARADWLLAKLG